MDTEGTQEIQRAVAKAITVGIPQVLTRRAPTAADPEVLLQTSAVHNPQSVHMKHRRPTPLLDRTSLL